MKKVWILEKFVTVEDMKKNINDLLESRENVDNDEAREEIDKIIEKFNNRLEKYPDGYWHGWQGKSIYRQFCDFARESMLYDKNAKYRVIEAEIKDDAKIWLGYKPIKENEGVLKYLYATLRS